MRLPLSRKRPGIPWGCSQETPQVGGFVESAISDRSGMSSGRSPAFPDVFRVACHWEVAITNPACYSNGIPRLW